MTRKAERFARYIDPVEEASRCLLCHDAPCTAACPRRKKAEDACDPAFFVRGIRFALGEAALESMEGCGFCKRCERACIHYDYPVRITDIRAALSGIKRRSVSFSLGLNNERYYRTRPKPLAADAGALTLDFCGVKCENPFFISSSIAAADYEMCARALRSGWGGVVYKTIGYGEIRDVSPRFDTIGKERTPFVGFRNLEQISGRPAKDNFADLKRLKEEFPNKVIAASIMGQNEAEWTALAEECEAARVDIIECNFSCPHMSEGGLGSDVGENPELVGAFIRAARKGSRLPILAKMTPNLSSMIPPAEAALAAGADGIAAINTVKSFTGFESGSLRALLDVDGKTSVSGYSGKAVKPIALRFIADLKTGKGTMDVPVSGMGGIETWKDALDFLLLGCGNLQVTTAVMQYGYRIIDHLKLGLLGFMRRHNYRSVTELVGKGIGVFAPANELDRQTLRPAVLDEAKCLGCGRCHLSCRDAGHSAIDWDPRKRRPAITAGCVGCHLCLHICPAGALHAGERRQAMQRGTGVAG
jgi:dihydropyrimidine dehydrogenase (NAD+) subunit PreA